MRDYKTFDDLPKRIQYFVETIKKDGFQDITEFEFPCKYYGEGSFGCKIWIDAEETAQGKIPYRGVVQGLVGSGGLRGVFGVGNTSILVRYKNKQQFGKKFLPELKKRLKESSAGGDVHSVRFDLQSYNDDPEVFVVLRNNRKMDTWRIIKNILEEFKIEKGILFGN